MPHIVHLVDNVSRQGGGIFESVIGFANEQSKYMQWTVTVAGIEDENTPADLNRLASRVSALLLPEAKADLFGKRLARLVEKTVPDVIHVHGIWGAGARAGYQLTRRCNNLGVVVSPHGMLDPWALRNSRWKKQLGWHAWAKLLIARADVIHALAKSERESVEAVARGKPAFKVIPNGVELAKLSALPQTAPKLVFLGRIHPKKGLPALLDAWAVLGGRLNGWHLYIAGWSEGGHEAALKAQCTRLGLEDSIKFLGPVFGEAKDKLLRSADAFILPSQSEGLPMAVLEAWSYSIPVVMTHECNLEEGFAAGAALAHRPNSKSLVEAIGILTTMSKQDRLAMGAKGRNLVERQFSWPKVAMEMISTYTDILK